MTGTDLYFILNEQQGWSQREEHGPQGTVSGRTLFSSRPALTGHHYKTIWVLRVKFPSNSPFRGCERVVVMNLRWNDWHSQRHQSKEKIQFATQTKGIQIPFPKKNSTRRSSTPANARTITRRSQNPVPSKLAKKECIGLMEASGAHPADLPVLQCVSFGPPITSPFFVFPTNMSFLKLKFLAFPK